MVIDENMRKYPVRVHFRRLMADSKGDFFLSLPVCNGVGRQEGVLPEVNSIGSDTIEFLSKNPPRTVVRAMGMNVAYTLTLLDHGRMGLDSSFMSS